MVLLDVFRICILDEEVTVFSVVGAGLCAVVAEAADVLVTNEVVMPCTVLDVSLKCFSSLFTDERVEVIAVKVSDLEKPCHVVDTCDVILEAVYFDSESLEKSGGANLNRVAETDCLHACESLHVACEDRHGVGVVEEPCIGTYFFNVVCEVVEYGNCTETSHDTADTECICNCLTEAVLLRDLEVDDCTGVVSTNLDSVNNEACAAESVLSLFNAEVLLDSSSVLVDVVVEVVHELKAFIETCAVDVVERDLHIMERISKHTVAEYVLNECAASCTHKGNFHV